jgi:hypothetical protein
MDYFHTWTKQSLGQDLVKGWTDLDLFMTFDYEGQSIEFWFDCHNFIIYIQIVTYVDKTTVVTKTDMWKKLSLTLTFKWPWKWNDWILIMVNFWHHFVSYVWTRIICWQNNTVDHTDLWNNYLWPWPINDLDCQIIEFCFW